MREMNSFSVLTGSDAKQEWLLPWWWDHLHHHHPRASIAFADFGMTSKAKEWCRKRGLLIDIPEPSMDELPQDRANFWSKKWENSGEREDLLPLRRVWYKKPMAMALSPFERTLWVDLDCEVRGPLDALFSLPLNKGKMAMSSVETNRLSQGELGEFPHYNTGIALFEKESPLIHLWVREIRIGSQFACTEEDLLAFLIAHFQIPVVKLPHLYNWEILRFGANPQAKVYHWMGEKGKQAIRESQRPTHSSSAPPPTNT